VGFFPRGKAARVWSADARLHPVLSLAMTGTVLLLPLYASMAGAGTALPLCARVMKTVIVKRNTVFCSGDWIYSVCQTI